MSSDSPKETSVYASASLETVAALAGVSKMTVSRVLRNYPHVTAKTRRKVEQALATTGYRPSPLVSSFMAQVRTQTVRGSVEKLGYVLMYPMAGFQVQPRHPIDALSIKGAEEEAARLGFGLEVFEVGKSMPIRRVEEIIYNRGIRGFILSPMPPGCSQVRLHWERYCTVTLGYSLQKPILPRVITDRYKSMLLALRETWKLGYRRIGLAMLARQDERFDCQFSAGYLLFHQRFAQGRSLPMFMPQNWNRTAFVRWINRHRPDAIIGFDTTLEEMRQIGLKVPDEIGFASLVWSRKERDASGFDPLPQKSAALAVQLLASQLSLNQFGLPVSPSCILMEGEWHPGRTLRLQKNIDPASPAGKNSGHCA